MRAHLGDQLVIESPATGGARRDGEIVGLHHDDGTPPYDVRWSDTDDVTLVFPGPDAHIRHLEDEQPTEAGGAPTTADEAAAAYTAYRPPGTGHAGDIGRRIAVERRRRGLSREETAGRARMSPYYLAYLEERPADPTLATLIRLADALGTSVAELRGGGIVFRTAPDSVAAQAAEREVAFEVDHVDDALSQGWSVLAVGPARVVTDPEAVRGLAQRAHATPWAGGEREMWVSIEPADLTGRRITPADQ